MPGWFSKARPYAGGTPTLRRATKQRTRDAHATSILVVDPGIYSRQRWGGPILMICLTAILVITGGRLRRLDPRGRVPSTLLSILGLLSFPVGTLINGYILYLLHSAKGRYVFSPEYQQVIAATPAIRYKTSKVVLILGGIVIVLLVLGLILSFSKGR